MSNSKKKELESTATTAADPAETDDYDPNAPFSSWLFLLASLIAGAMVLPVLKIASTELAMPLPAEYEELVAEEQNQDAASKASGILGEVKTVNLGRVLMALGGTMAIVFGWATGFIHGRVLFGIIGAIVGIGLAVALGMFLPQYVMDLQSKAMIARDHADFYSMAVHASQWLIITAPIVLAVGIAVGRPSSFLKSAGVVVMAAILGAVIYVIGGTMMDGNLALGKVAPHDGNTGYVWAFATPLLTGLFLSRTRL